jgi:hypothetical protein
MPTVKEAFMYSAHDDVTKLPLRARLAIANSMITLLDTDTTLTILEQARASAKLYAATEDADAPKILCWAVVQHYHDGFAQPVVELGCVTKEQAEDLANAIAKYEGAHADRKGWKHDSYVVEKHEVEPDWIVREEMTGAKYVELYHARLGCLR